MRSRNRDSKRRMLSSGIIRDQDRERQSPPTWIVAASCFSVLGRRSPTATQPSSNSTSAVTAKMIGWLLNGCRISRQVNGSQGLWTPGDGPRRRRSFPADPPMLTAIVSRMVTANGQGATGGDGSIWVAVIAVLGMIITSGAAVAARGRRIGRSVAVALCVRCAVIERCHWSRPMAGATGIRIRGLV
jgi:hypothetical protein